MAGWESMEGGHELDLAPLLGAGEGPRRARAVRLGESSWAALLLWDQRTHLRVGNLVCAAHARRAALEEARRLAPEHAPVLDALIERSAVAE